MLGTIVFILTVKIISPEKICRDITSASCACFNFEIDWFSSQSLMIDCENCKIKEITNYASAINETLLYKNCSSLDAIISADILINPLETGRNIEELLKDDFQKVLFENLQHNLSIKHLKIIHNCEGSIFNQIIGLTSINYDNNMNFNVTRNIFKGSENVVEVSLTNDGISVLDSFLISDLKLIEHLDLSHNKIDFIPENFFNKTESLKYLKMSYNNLTTLTEYV